MAIEIEDEGSDAPVTVLTGEVEQAALHGLLRRLYSLGLPLISVICTEPWSWTPWSGSPSRARCPRWRLRPTRTSACEPIERY